MWSGTIRHLQTQTIIWCVKKHRQYPKCFKDYIRENSTLKSHSVFYILRPKQELTASVSKVIPRIQYVLNDNLKNY